MPRVRGPLEVRQADMRRRWRKRQTEHPLCQHKHSELYMVYGGRNLMRCLDCVAFFYARNRDDSDLLPFSIIGKRLGISRAAAEEAYERGMRKLRNDPRPYYILQSLGEELERERGHRTVIE